MTSRRRDEESAELGMPLGTAANKLRKLIMFHLLKSLGENICYRCGQPIEVPDTLSIDHKEPWLNRDPALFWDLHNIAFSHVRCNCRVSSGGDVSGASRRKVGPAGTAWCSRCKQFLPVKNFTRNVTTWNGYSSWCLSLIHI